MLKIGISCCFFHPDPHRSIFKGKTLYYIEQSMAHWVNSGGALAWMIPPVKPHSPIQQRDLIHEMDGLILHGGADVSPKSYGQTPLRPEWAGDEIRDQFEIELFREFLAQQKPVLGICRGAQLMNVACGGTLYQDIPTELPEALTHRDGESYDKNFHPIRLAPHSRLQELYPQCNSLQINSVHHQAIKKLGNHLQAEAWSDPDGIIEAIRLESNTFAFAVQWHPEFQDPLNTSLLKSQPLLEDFLDFARKRKENHAPSH